MCNITETIEIVKPYDHQGAAIYIAVILIWYSTGLAMMLFLQVRPRTIQQQFLFDSSDSSTKKRLQSLSTNPFASYRNIQADNTTKQILNELKDPERRERLWKIYFASGEKQNETHGKYYQTITSDRATIDRIKRKLADIHRTDVANDDSVLSSPTSVSTNDNRSVISALDSTKLFSKRFPSLRRPNGGTTNNNRPSLLRVHSEIETSSASNSNIERESLVSGKQSFAPSITGSRKRNSKFSNRFTIEKVSHEDPAPPCVKKSSIE
ncbi:hypothetical protein I4U23_018796 [Adineta vaga]|nr:hypothetical protein I4U23_018796 [Adineta vaga]